MGLVQRGENKGGFFSSESSITNVGFENAGVVESVPAARRAITGNGVNVLAMGAFYVAPEMGKAIADAYLSASLGSDYTWWPNFYEFHKLAMDELDAFDYAEYKANGFKVNKLGDFPLQLETKPE